SQGQQLYVSDRVDAVPVPWARTIEPQALFDYFYFHMIPAPRTIYDRIRRLEPGSSLLFTATGTTHSTYWNPQFQERSGGNHDELREEFRTLIREAVAREVNGTKAGCFLSGGTDSSTVAGLLGLVTGEPARTYSIGFDAAGYDEMHYARIAARHFRT